MIREVVRSFAPPHQFPDGPNVQRLLALLVIVGLAAVGAVLAPPGPDVDGTPSVSPTASTAAPTSLPTPTAAPTSVGVVRTPTGVPVIVEERLATGWRVTTPCEATAEVAGAPVAGGAVVLDPGHGGPVDTGAVGFNGLREADLNLTLSVAAARVLEERGIPTVLTRVGDYATTLPFRAGIADAIGARALVSIHHNAPQLNASDVPGTEVFVQSGSSESARLGGLLHQAVTFALDQFDVDWDRASDAGVLRVLNSDGEDAYGMVRRPSAPAVLLELGYLANPPEAELFATDAYIEVASVALADAIEAWLTTDLPGNGFGNGPRTRDPAASAAGRECVDPDLG